MYGHMQVYVEAYPPLGSPQGILSICKNNERKTKKLKVVIFNNLKFIKFFNALANTSKKMCLTC